MALASFGHADSYDVPSGEVQVQSSQITGAGNAVTVTGGGTLVLTNSANSYGGGTTVNDGSTLQVGVDGDLGTASGGITLGDSTASGTLDLSTSKSAVTSGRNITLDPGGGSILTGTGGTWTLTGIISNSNLGPGALTVGGSGTLVLDGANTYSGGTNITGGTVQISSDGNLGSGGTVAMSAGSTLLFSAGGTYAHAVTLSGDPTFDITSGQSVTYGGQITDGASPGTLGVTGGGTLLLTNTANSYSGGTTVVGGSTLSVGSDSVLGAATGRLTLGNGTTTGILDTRSSAAPVTSTRDISIGGDGGSILVGANAWTLGGIVSGGPLSVNGGGILALTNASNSFSALNIAGNSTVQAATDANLGSGTVTLGDAVSSGILDLRAATAAVSSARDYTLNAGGGTFLAGSNAWTLSGVISGVGGLTVAGGGTLVLSGANTYTGNTAVIDGSTLQISADTNLGGTTTGTVFVTNSTLDLSGASSSARTIALGGASDTLDMSDGTWVFSNPVTGAGALTVAGTGELVLDAANAYTGGTTITGGTLVVGDSSSPGASITGNVTLMGGTLAGYGTVSGLVTNTAGIVAPGGGAPGALTVGSFTQTANGTTSITVSPLGVSALDVTGAATLGGKLNLVFQGNFHTETVDLINAGSITGVFSSVTGALSSAISQNIIYTSNAVELQLVQIALPQNPSIYPAVTNVSLNAAQSDNDTILDRLVNLRTEAVVDDMYMADDPMHRAGISNGKSPYGAWFKGLGGYSSISGSSAAPSYDTRGGGFVTGMDFEFAPGLVGGVALSYNLSSISESGGASADIDTPRLMVYGGWWHGPIVLDGTLGLGYASIDTSRPIAANGSTAMATFGGPELTSAFQAASPMHFGPIAFTPSVGFDYAWLDQRGANETGGATYDLNVLSNATNSLRPFIAATAATRFDWGYSTAIEPQLRLGYETEILSTSRTALVQPVGDDQVFDIPGVTPSRGLLVASAGVKVETNRNLAFFANVEASEAPNAHSLGGNIGVRYRF